MTDRRRPTTRPTRDPSLGEPSGLPSHAPTRDPARRDDRGRREGAEGPAADAAANATTGGRWFLACWPDAATRRALQQRQADWAWPKGARPTPAARLHLTLHFLGALPAGALPALQRALDAVEASEPATWTLSRVEIWPNGIAALVPARVPDAAATLHAALADVLRRQGLPVESRAWRPHITLARRARGATAAGADAAGAVRWTTSGFELVCSDHGYHRVGRWPLTARDTGRG